MLRISLFSIRSPGTRAYNLLYRWFMGLAAIDDTVLHSANRERLFKYADLAAFLTRSNTPPIGDKLPATNTSGGRHARPWASTRFPP